MLRETYPGAYGQDFVPLYPHISALGFVTGNVMYYVLYSPLFKYNLFQSAVQSFGATALYDLSPKMTQPVLGTASNIG